MTKDKITRDIVDTLFTKRLLSLHAAFDYFHIRHIAKTGRYQVIADRVVGTEEDTDHIVDRTERRVGLYLRLATFGLYLIPHRKNYAWSELYYMSDDGIYNTAIDGDTFYIVTADNKTVLVAYNAKFFEWKGK